MMCRRKKVACGSGDSLLIGNILAKGLSQMLRIHIFKKLGTVDHSCSPSTEEGKTSRPGQMA